MAGGVGRGNWREVVVVCLVAGVVAGWLTLGGLQGMNHADSVVPALMSLYRWTWFYWGQDRFGMLTALVAMPVRDPLGNLLVQNWMVSFCGVLVFALVHAYLLGWRGAGISGVLGAGVFLVFGPGSFHSDYLLDNQPYAVSSCLGVLGLMALVCGGEGRRRWVGLGVGGGVLFLAFWVSLGAAFLVVPLFVGGMVCGVGGEGKQWRRLAVIAGAAVVNWGVMLGSRYRGSGGGSGGWSGVGGWPGGWGVMGGNVWREMPVGLGVGVLVLVGMGVAGWVVGRDRGVVRARVVACAMVALVAAVYFLVVGATAHVRESGFPYRYAIPSVVLVVAAAGMFGGLALEGAWGKWRVGVGAVLVAGVLVGITWRYGRPSYGRVREMVDGKFGGATKELVAAGCTHVIGDYWDVWGSVFHVNLTAYEAGSGRVVWGITTRGEVTEDLWRPGLREGRVGVVRSEKSEGDWRVEARKFGIGEMRVVEEGERIRVMEVVK